jgi:two-component system response regulator
MSTTDLKVVLGATIRTQRSALGISQEELAYRADLHRTYVSDVERGTRNPSVESIQKIAQALEISVAMLFEQAGNGTHAKQMVEILLVEDNPEDIQLALRGFEKAKVTNPVHVLRDGAEALEFIFATGPYAERRDGRRPRIILLDLSLPGKSGVEVLRQIKADKTTRDIPVIILATSDCDPDLEECRRRGVIAYMLKPVEFPKLSEVTADLSFGWTLVKPTA